MQGTFQAIITTDETVTFAVFIYEDDLEAIDNIQYYQVGFTTGDGNVFVNIVGRDPATNYTGDLQKISVFRIDGMNSCYVNTADFGCCVYYIKELASRQCCLGKCVVWML